MNHPPSIEIGDFVLTTHKAPHNHFYLTSTAHEHTVCLPQSALDGTLMRLFEDKLIADDKQALAAHEAETDAWVHYDSF